MSNENTDKTSSPPADSGIKIFALIEDQVVRPGAAACFTVDAEPAGTRMRTAQTRHLIRFQWLKNNEEIKGANGPSYEIGKVRLEDGGFYTCRIATDQDSVIAGAVEKDAPGARLFIKEGDHSLVQGPVQPGYKTKSCIGPYYGKVTFKNLNNSIWWPVPTGMTSCTITDMTHTTMGYSCKVEGVDNLTLQNWCGVNTVTFNVVAGHKYSFTTYITNPLPPPPSGAVLSLDIVWT